LKEEALDRTMWRNRFGRGFGPVVWQITDDDNEPFSENRDVCEIIWKNAAQPGRPQMKIWCMNIACWITKTKNTRFSTATLVKRKRLNDTLYVHCEFCFELPFKVYGLWLIAWVRFMQ